METIFEIKNEGNRVGEAELREEPLYYQIKCRFTGVENEFYQVSLITSQKTINLGTAVPDGKSYRLEKRVSVRQAGAPPFHFCIRRKYCGEKTFYPITESAPFPYISHLISQHLIYEKGSPGVLLRPE